MKLFEILEENSKNLHIEHLEDEIFNSGATGAKKAISFLASVYKLLSGHSETPVSVTVKWDGAPAIICGVNPENGRFFVGSKSVFAKNAKINYTPQDIDVNHGEVEGLAKKLKLALQYLPSLGIQTVVQGDFMFDSKDLKTVNIDGDQHISFKPNTITYVVPTESELGKQIQLAKLGIIFHTEYVGDTLPEMKANFGYSVAGLTKTPNVWFDDATYKDVSGTATLTQNETDEIKNRILSIQSAFGTVPTEVWQALQENTVFVSTFKIFINTKIREGHIGTDSNKLLSEYSNFFKAKIEKEISELKSNNPESKPVKARLEKLKASNEFIQKNQRDLLGVIDLFIDLMDIKNTLIKKLQIAQNIGTFIETDNGDLQATAPEGFVAVDRIGNAVKLVDRMSFSRANFLSKKEFGRK